jgi:hypothetical protein
VTFVFGAAEAAAGGGDVEDGEGAERMVDGAAAGAEPGAASSVIHAGNVRPRPLPAMIAKKDVRSDWSGDWRCWRL